MHEIFSSCKALYLKTANLNWSLFTDRYGNLAVDTIINKFIITA